MVAWSAFAIAVPVLLLGYLVEYGMRLLPFSGMP
jgi:hypothetical protein